MKNRIVNKFKGSFSVILFLLCTLPFLLTGCSNKHDDFYGKWGYIHDPETVIINFMDNGKLVYKGEKYDYVNEDSRLELTAKDGNVSTLRYMFSGDNLYIYETTVYTFEDSDILEDSKSSPTNEIVGRWVNKETKWSFEFTEEGTFQEDGYFPGYYVIHPENSSIQLIYNDQFEDTYVYYTLEDNKLTLEYPWCMVKQK